MKKLTTVGVLTLSVVSLAACSSGTSGSSSSASAAASSLSSQASSAASSARLTVAGACEKIQSAIANKGETADELKAELESIKADSPPAVQAAITIVVDNISPSAMASASAARESASAQASAATSKVYAALVPVCQAVGVELTPSDSESMSVSQSPSSS